MRFLFRVVLVAVVLMLSLPPLGVVAEQNTPATLRVAKIGNMSISQFDVDYRVQSIMPMQLGFHGNAGAEKIAEIKQNALDELIDRAYKVQYAIDEEISIEASLFETEWQKLLNNNKQLADSAQAAIADKIKANIYLDLLADKSETIAVEEKITVTDENVAMYYEENKEKYFRPKLYSASHVFVKVDPADNAEEKKVKLVRAEELFKRAQAGEDFYNLAYYESDDRSKYVGGSLGSFHAGQTVAEFDAAIQDMKPGEIVGPIRTLYGFHVIKLDSVDEPRQLSFDEVAAKIRTNLKEEEREKINEQWMSALKEKYPIELLTSK
jgi:parvulin-like peptidyl-prolyl isomerase